jgi:flagellar hook-associated protein 1 FlgK
VIGLDFSGGATGVAAQLQTLMGPGFAVSGSGSTLQILDDGAGNTTNVNALTGRSTSTATQSAGLGLSLFVDNGGADFTDALDGLGQRTGFAARISVNSALVTNNQLLVQYAPGGSLGDDARADYLLEQLDNMRFATFDPNGKDATYRFSGSVSDVITQAINFQGSVAETAISNADMQAMTLDAITTRLDQEYGVDVDEEMARLMELQNAYAANARVLASIQELLKQLMSI